MIRYGIFETTMIKVKDYDELSTDNEHLVTLKYFTDIKFALEELSKYKSRKGLWFGPNKTKLYEANRYYIRECIGEPIDFNTYTWAFLTKRGSVIAVAPYENEGNEPIICTTQAGDNSEV